MSKSKKELSFAEEVEQSLRKKFRKNIWCKFTKAINEYELVKPGDRIAVCISGGKDSMLLAKLFQELKRHNKFDFEVKFLVMDPGYSPVNRQVIEENARRLEIPIEIFESEIFESVFNIEMIEENQSTMGLGGGAITKIVIPENEYRDYIERYVNPKDPALYIREMSERMEAKKELFLKLKK